MSWPVCHAATRAKTLTQVGNFSTSLYVRALFRIGVMTATAKLDVAVPNVEMWEGERYSLVVLHSGK